jgi:hypothetical protein
MAEAPWLIIPNKFDNAGLLYFYIMGLHGGFKWSSWVLWLSMKITWVFNGAPEFFETTIQSTWRLHGPPVLSWQLQLTLGACETLSASPCRHRSIAIAIAISRHFRTSSSLGLFGFQSYGACQIFVLRLYNTWRGRMDQRPKALAQRATEIVRGFKSWIFFRRKSTGQCHALIWIYLFFFDIAET